MRHQNNCKNGFSPQSLRGLLVLGAWVSSTVLLNLGIATRATAEDLVIPEVDSNAAPASTAPSPAASESAPLPAPEAASPEPAPLPPLPSADPAPRWMAPTATDPAPEAPAAQASGQSDMSVDKSQNYDLGATEYVPPADVVVTQRGGCQASIAPGQAIGSNLCGSALSRSAVSEASAPAPTQSWSSSSNWQQTAPAWTAVENTQAIAEPPPIHNTRWRIGSIPTVRPLQRWVIKPLTNANPLKWMLANGERMIFPLPIPVDITSIFGMRNHPIFGEARFHSGVDLGAAMGTPVLAAYSGRVSLAEFLGGYGLSVLLEHDQGQQATQYAHLSELLVKPGQWVQQGTVIGLVGSTGQSTGPHLHFELQQQTADGLVAVDPLEGLQMAMVQLAQALQTARLAAHTPPRQPDSAEPGDS